ncbi:hypothetical protein AB1Y20_017992 [Prymnesium parvum]|uniref:EF-hand domain-containing protein n=1 Tax=Prymnesium parvum TaxID=97485 RepID=A0AB34JPZ5_PRYPA
MHRPAEPISREEKRALLTHILNTSRTLTHDERELLRRRAFGGGRRTHPDLKIAEIAPLPARPRRASDRLGQALHDAQHESPAAKAARAQKEPFWSPALGPPGERAPPVDRRRVRELQNGKAVLQATTTSTRPIFREMKPVWLADASQLGPPDKPEPPPGRLRPGASSEGGGDGVAARGQERSAAKTDFTLDLMMMLNSQNLVRLKQQAQFAKYRDELSVQEFCSVMQRHLTAHLQPTEQERIHFVAKLAELFAQIDVNGDERMEWQELTSFLVEALNGADLSNPILKYREIEPILDQTRLRSEQSVEKVYYFEQLDRLLLCEGPSAGVLVYSPQASACKNDLKGHTREVLAAEIIEEIACVVTSGADLALCFWDVAGATPSWKLRQRASVGTSQLALRWCPGSSPALFSAGADGALLMWDVVSLAVVYTLPGHKDSVTSLVLLRQLKSLLASSSLDGTIRLWDVQQRPPRECHLLRGHERGVNCLAFSNDFRHLFSGGLDHELLVWNPQSETIICALRNHLAAITAIEAVQGTPQVVSADCAGVICIWDCRSLSCSQKLAVQVPPGYQLTSIAVLPKHRQIACAARRLAMFQGPEETQPWLTDGQPLAVGLYNTASRSFVTASGCNVMIWDAATGRLLRKFCDVTAAPITAICFDDRERKLILADHKGSMRVINYSNGALMKRMQSHTAEVSQLLYVPSRQHIISTSWDRNIMLQDESQPDVGKLIRTTPSGHACDVTCAAFSQRFDLLATGADDGSLQVWQLDERGVPHPEERLVGHSCCITAMTFLEPWGLLCSADSCGEADAGPWSSPLLRVASVRFPNSSLDGRTTPPEGADNGEGSPASKRFSQTSQSVTFMTETAASERVPPPEERKGVSEDLSSFVSGCAVTALSFSPERKTISWGDDYGRIAIWNLAPLLKALPSPEEPEIEQPGNAKPRVTLSFAAPDLSAMTSTSPKSRMSRAKTGLISPSASSPVSRSKTGLSPVQRTKNTFSVESVEEAVDSDGTSSSPSPTAPIKDTNSPESKWLIGKLLRIKVRVLHVWQAHSDSISSLQSIAEPAALFSCSTDRLASVWKHDGSEAYGTLRRGESGPRARQWSSWRFPVNALADSSQMTARATDILQQVGSERFVKRAKALDTPEVSDDDSEDGSNKVTKAPGIGYQPSTELCKQHWHLRRPDSARGAPQRTADLGAKDGSKSAGNTPREVEGLGLPCSPRCTSSPSCPARRKVDQLYQKRPLFAEGSAAGSVAASRLDKLLQEGSSFQGIKARPNVDALNSQHSAVHRLQSPRADRGFPVGASSSPRADGVGGSTLLPAMK